MHIDGKKTYIVAALMVLMAVTEMIGPGGFDWQAGIDYFFGGAALATIRSAMAKQQS